MSSVLTNTASMSALQTLRSISGQMSDTQRQVASGLRVGTASDNSAYWSIATTMRSDNLAISAVQDALGLGATKVDTAYTGMSSVVDVLTAFKAKLVAANEDAVDKTKIQADLEQFKQQVVSIAQSSSFSGENWLNTNVVDIYDNELNIASVTSSFIRDKSAGVAVKKMDIHLSEVSLFNNTGGGLLQADMRDSKTIGGIRTFSEYDSVSSDRTLYYNNVKSGWMYPERATGSAAMFRFDSFPVGSPLDFNSPGAEIKFDILLDKESAADDLPGPYDPGFSTTGITITKADVDMHVPALGGIISTNTEFAAVLNTKLVSLGARASAAGSISDPLNPGHTIHNPEYLSIYTSEMHGDGSYVEISNLSSVGVSTGGMTEGAGLGSRGSKISLTFEDFIVHQDGDNDDGVEISFTFALNNGAATTHTFNRTYVNQVLGKDDGKVATAEEMATLLHSLLDADWPDLIIEADASGGVTIESDPAVDRKTGGSTRIDFGNIRVNIEPLPTINFLDIDVDQNPDMITGYINYMEVVTQRITDGAALLGALQMRIDMQLEFGSKQMDSMDQSIGRLVDANMSESSTRLKALQTQEQLAVQSLSIANTGSENIIALFRQ